MLNELLNKIVKRGYGWYLLFKILKSILAIPVFIAWISIFLLAGIYVCLSEIISIIWGEFVLGTGAEIIDFWKKPWFRNYSRSFYNELHQPKKEPQWWVSDIEPEEVEEDDV